ncbi:MAG TPA: T9SS type A sorting domain-containing protein [Ferruginibacter sp.]|nr:T9SS type A sorting domain-containing protein [Ferruginibacter sp.]
MKNILFLIAIFGCTSNTHGQVINTICGTGTAGYTGDNGPAILAEIWDPFGIKVDRKGNIYYADNFVVRKIDKNGIITTFAGDGTAGYSGDGGAATMAQFRGPAGIAVDDTGNVYIADYYTVRKVDTFGIVTTVAGTGVLGFSGDGSQATAAQMRYPNDVALDRAGNLYIADFGDSRIRKVTPFGIISTFAGTGVPGFNGDNIAATAAQINEPFDVAVDSVGNVYFSDVSNGRIRKISVSTGIITTIGGNGIPGFTGDGGPATNAELDGGAGLAMDSIGNLYFSDVINNRIRRINTSGIISTIAGNGTIGFSGDGGNPLMAEFNKADKIAVDNKDRVYISDRFNQRIRLISYNVSVPGINSGDRAMAIYPNPSAGVFTVHIGTNSKEQTQISITDVTGQQVKNISATTNTTFGTTLDVPDGIYYIQAATSNSVYTGKIVIMR